MRKKHRYRKPYRIKKKKSIFKSRIFWLSFLFFVLLGGAFYFFVFSSFFQIKQIIISGNQKVKTQEIEKVFNKRIKKKIIFLDTKSIFTANLKAINQEILDRYPQILRIKSKRSFPDILNVNIQERKPIGIWQKGKEFFYFDKEGVIFERANEFKKPVILCEVEKPIIFGKPIIKKENLYSILEINKRLKSFGIDIKDFIISGDEKKLKVETEDGWYILFNLERDVPDQIFNFKLVFEEKISPEKKENLEYVDLRFGNRIFFK